MKTLLTAFAVFVGFGITAFGGTVIVQKMEGSGMSGEMVTKIEGSKSRTDLPHGMSTIANAATGEVATIMHAQKSYIKISGDSAKSMMEQYMKMQGQEEKTARPELKPTGKKEKINGYDTELYTVDMGNTKTVLWIAKDYPDYKKILQLLEDAQKGSMSKMVEDATPDPKKFPGMPIKTEVESAMQPGAPPQKITMTLMSVKEEKLAPAEFEVPAGYSEMSMPKMELTAPQ